ncbi:MAG: hypothetical protein ACOZAA_12900 [Pseudomonadota bacterium]
MRKTSPSGYCAIFALLIASAAAAAEPLPEEVWLAPKADRVAALTMTPGECVTSSVDPQAEYLAELGRAAFKSPMLLGGQAARGGLSCNSCHVDGRANPDFYLEGLSGAPGTADVSSSLFSKIRDDGVFNPLPIPTLVGVRGKSSFGTLAPKPNLRAFIGSAIIEEFQGAPTPSAILDGLVAYIETMSAAACPASPAPLTPARAMDDVRRTLAAARGAVERDDFAAADFLLVSAQSAIGRIHARFPGDDSAALRAALGELSRKVGAVRNSPRDPQAMASVIHEIDRSAVKLGKKLQRARASSLYDEKMLAARLERR